MGQTEVVLQDVFWSFSGDPFTERGAFETSLRQYQKDINNIDSWSSAEPVILTSQIRVQYMHWKDDKQIESIITLNAENCAGFSTGELMFLLHNAVVEQLRGIDHHFFEGLALIGEQEDERPPLYVLCQGS